jgi:hypothetical protein
LGNSEDCEGTLDASGICGIGRRVTPDQLEEIDLATTAVDPSQIAAPRDALPAVAVLGDN